MPIEFEALASRLLQQARSLLAEWFPEGRLLGHEFEIGDLGGSPGDSLRVNINTGKWKDFASGEAGGDLISLYAAIHGLKQGEAVRALEGDGTIQTRVRQAPAVKDQAPRETWTPILPVPETAGEPPDYYSRRVGNASEWVKLDFIKRWPYRNAAGDLLGYAVRFEWFEKDRREKDIVPQTFCTNGQGKTMWRWKAFDGERPLYGLDQLAARPDAPVMLVEGEKKVEALKIIAPQYVGICWMGGASAWKKSDWSPLKGRTITCWPDADKQVVKNKVQAEKFKVEIGARIPRDDQPGMRAMWEIGHHLLKMCPTVKIIIPDDETLPDGWDCADAVVDGWDWQRLKAWAVPKLFNLTEGVGYGQGQHKQGAAGAGVHGYGRRADNGEHAGTDGSGSVAGPAATRGDHIQQGHRADSRQTAVQSVAGGGDGVDTAQAGHRERNVLQGQSGRTAETDRRPASGSLRADGAGRDAGGGGEPERGDRGRSVDRDQKDRGDPRPESGLQRADGVLPQASPATQTGEAPLSQVGRWLQWGIERSGNGLPIVNLNNAVRVLEADPALRGLVWFDDFLNRLMTGEPAREWTDADDVNLTLYLQREIGISKMGRSTVADAAIAIAMRDRRNCVKDWIASLPKHDGVARIEEFMIRVFGCTDTAYTRAASRNFWISIVARIYMPGCKVDNMIILEGGQGGYKSSCLEAIASPWFAEQHESATNPKAFAEVLQGKALTEIAEMDSFNRAEVNTIKKVVSCKSDRFRASYGRHAADHPRQGIMVGSTNRDDWNKDDTGARRFWPIACRGVADIQYVIDNRAQCFAEAVSILFRVPFDATPAQRIAAGAAWWEMPDAETKAEQRKRYDADPWITPISDWLMGQQETSVNDIARVCLEIDVADLDRTRQMRIAGVLRALGWTNNGNQRRSGKVVKIWTPPGDSYGVATSAENVATFDDVNAHLQTHDGDDVNFSGDLPGFE